MSVVSYFYNRNVIKRFIEERFSNPTLWMIFIGTYKIEKGTLMWEI